MGRASLPAGNTFLHPDPEPMANSFLDPNASSSSSLPSIPSLTSNSPEACSEGSLLTPTSSISPRVGTIGLDSLGTGVKLSKPTSPHDIIEVQSFSNSEENYHPTKRPTRKRTATKKTKKNKWQCDVCGKVLGRKPELQRHREIHVGFRNICEMEGCDHTWLQLSNYKTHRKTKHRKVRIQACKSCGMRIPDLELRTNHQLETHPEEFKVQCEYRNGRYVRRAATTSPSSASSSPPTPQTTGPLKTNEHADLESDLEQDEEDQDLTEEDQGKDSISIASSSCHPTIQMGSRTRSLTSRDSTSTSVGHSESPSNYPSYPSVYEGHSSSYSRSYSRDLDVTALSSPMTFRERVEYARNGYSRSASGYYAYGQPGYSQPSQQPIYTWPPPPPPPHSVERLSSDYGYDQARVHPSYPSASPSSLYASYMAARSSTYRPHGYYESDRPDASGSGSTRGLDIGRILPSTSTPDDFSSNSRRRGDRARNAHGHSRYAPY